MTNALIPEYSSVEQLCEKWRYDKNQLKHAIEKYNIGLWICIENTKNIFDMNLSVFESKINTITSDEIIRVSALTDEELSHEGYAISSSPDPDIFYAQKADSKFYIDYNNNRRLIFVSHFPLPEETVHHDGFVELCDESFNDPRKDIANLFEEGQLYVVYVKCKKYGYMRFLSPACSITCMLYPASC